MVVAFSDQKNDQKNIKIILAALLCFWFRILASETIIFRVILPLQEPLVATFSEPRAPTSRKYVTELGIIMPNLSETLQSLWSHFSVFALEKYP